VRLVCSLQQARATLYVVPELGKLEKQIEALFKSRV
jgi:hypothetical protein